MSRLNYLPLYANVLYDILLLSLSVTSVMGQCSGDYSDPEHASKHPWYLIHGCTESTIPNRGYCHGARASSVFFLLAALLYGSRLSWTAVRGRNQERHLVRFRNMRAKSCC